MRCGWALAALGTFLCLLLRSVHDRHQSVLRAAAACCPTSQTNPVTAPPSPPQRQESQVLPVLSATSPAGNPLFHLLCLPLLALSCSHAVPKAPQGHLHTWPLLLYCGQPLTSSKRTAYSDRLLFRLSVTPRALFSSSRYNADASVCLSLLSVLCMGSVGPQRQESPSCPPSCPRPYNSRVACSRI